MKTAIDHIGSGTKDASQDDIIDHTFTIY